jgi:hypothetical protein
MKYIKKYEIFESTFGDVVSTNKKYRELAKLLQSEILDDYDIYEGPLSEYGPLNRQGSYTNEACWHFTNPGGVIYNISIFPKNRQITGRDFVKTLVSDLESFKNRVEESLDIEYEIEEHETFVIIMIGDEVDIN